MQLGMVIVLFSEEELQKMDDAEKQKNIAILKCPKGVERINKCRKFEDKFFKGPGKLRS